jgi:hypothetical protein
MIKDELRSERVHSTIMSGANRRTAMEVVTVNAVKVIKQNLLMHSPSDDKKSFFSTSYKILKSSDFTHSFKSFG